MTELKPCPFCGSGLAREPGRYTNASFSGVELMLGNGSWFVWCGTCCCEGSRSLDKAEAIAAWNSRAAPRADGDDGELVDWLNARAAILNAGAAWGCDEDGAAMNQAAARITALSAEVERLRASAKNNNQLARMYKAQADEFRSKYVAAVGQD